MLETALIAHAPAGRAATPSGGDPFDIWARPSVLNHAAGGTTPRITTQAWPPWSGPPPAPAHAGGTRHATDTSLDNQETADSTSRHPPASIRPPPRT